MQTVRESTDALLEHRRRRARLFQDRGRATSISTTSRCRCGAWSTQVRDTLDHLATSKGVRLRLVGRRSAAGASAGRRASLAPGAAEPGRQRDQVQRRRGRRRQCRPARELAAAGRAAMHGRIHRRRRWHRHGRGGACRACSLRSCRPTTRRPSASAAPAWASASRIAWPISWAARSRWPAGWAKGRCFTLRMAFDWLAVAAPTRPAAADEFGDSALDTFSGLEGSTMPMPLSASSASRSGPADPGGRGQRDQSGRDPAAAGVVGLYRRHRRRRAERGRSLAQRRPRAVADRPAHARARRLRAGRDDPPRRGRGARGCRSSRSPPMPRRPRSSVARRSASTAA